jgi:hypothetical protein
VGSHDADLRDEGLFQTPVSDDGPYGSKKPIVRVLDDEKVQAFQLRCGILVTGSGIARRPAPGAREW